MEKRSVPSAGLLALALCLAGSIALGAQPTADEGPFIRENSAAMAAMMAGMAAKPTGDVDADFVAMMIPHHQGAIDMAMAELRYGHNEQLRRISQEIVAMRLALGEPPPASAPAPTQIQPPASPSAPQPPSTPPAMKMK